MEFKAALDSLISRKFIRKWHFNWGCHFVFRLQNELPNLIEHYILDANQNIYVAQPIITSFNTYIDVLVSCMLWGNEKTGLIRIILRPINHLGTHLLIWINFNPTRIINHKPSKLWDKILYTFPNIVSHFTGHKSTYLCWDWSQSMLVKGVPRGLQQSPIYNIL